MNNEEKKEILEVLVFAIVEGNRAQMVATIKQYAGDEMEQLDDVWKIAILTDEQLKRTLFGIYKYYQDEE